MEAALGRQWPRQTGRRQGDLPMVSSAAPDIDVVRFSQERDDGPPQEATEGTPAYCGKRVEMKEDVFNELLESVRQGGEILRGERKPSRVFSAAEPDARQIRESYGLSQEKFASLMGISVGTLRNWEQGRRNPEGPARVLLRVAAKHPEAVLDVVREHRTRKTA